MNITDIDDKIIKRARQNYLYEKYCKNISNLEQLLADQEKVFNSFMENLKKNTDPDKKVMMEKILDRMTSALDDLKNAVSNKDVMKITEAQNKFLIEAKDPISDWLDKNEGATVTENSIFESLPRYWEDEFHNDMKALNVNILKNFFNLIF